MHETTPQARKKIRFMFQRKGGRGGERFYLPRAPRTLSDETPPTCITGSAQHNLGGVGLENSKNCMHATSERCTTVGAEEVRLNRQFVVPSCLNERSACCGLSGWCRWAGLGGKMDRFWVSLVLRWYGAIEEEEDGGIRIKGCDEGWESRIASPGLGS